MTTQPDPSRDLVDQLTDVLAETGDNCGPGDYRQQAADVLAWLDERRLLLSGPDSADVIEIRKLNEQMDQQVSDLHHQLCEQRRELASLRALLGLQPGQTLCGASSGGHEPMTCLLPAEHTTVVGEGWHRSLGGSWTA